MKFMKRTQTFKGSNVTFDPKAMTAYSYGWWQFVARVNGKIVFNNYSYSNSTRKHQNKVSHALASLGLKADLTVSTSKSLDSSQAGPDALRNAYRAQDFDRAARISEVFKIKMSRREIDALYVEMEEQACNDFLIRSVRRQERLEREAFQERARALEQHLDQVAFRDYDICDRVAFGDAENPMSRKVAVHQVVELETLEQDVENALHSFQRDGFGSVVFYV